MDFKNTLPDTMENVIMENEYMRSPEEGPSPAGADPGGEEMASGQRPGRRTRPGRVQPEVLPTIQRNQIIPEVSPIASATLENQPGLTSAGLPRQRMRWTVSMNGDILRAYYRVTNCERDRSGYGQRLFEEFNRMYPEFTVSAQRVADQYRTIIRNNLIPQPERNAIKYQINAELQRNSYSPNTAPFGDEISNENTPDPPQSVDPSPPQITSNWNERLGIEMRRALSMFEGTNAVHRPPIPRVNTSRKTAAVIEVMNKEIIPPYLSDVHDLENLHLIVYCAAMAVVKELRVKLDQDPNRTRRSEKIIPAWERRLLNSIENLRKDIARVEALVQGVNTRRLNKIVSDIIRRHRIHSLREQPNTTPQQCLDTLKQKLSVKSTRLTRYRKNRARKTDNAAFYRSEKAFYRALRDKKNTTPSNYPSAQQIFSFWSEQLATNVDFNHSAEWIQLEENRLRDLPCMEFHQLDISEVQGILRNLMNWKTPGPDKLQNFWLKRFTCIHGKLTELINNVIQHPHDMPHFLTQGTTYLLEKDPCSRHDPSKYRPITCLPTLYKIITSCLALRINMHCDRNNIIAEQQKGCRKGSRGCKEQLTIDAVVCDQAYRKRRNLSMAYIDYRKAFDSVPHGWLLKVLGMYKIHPIVITFLSRVMANWRTRVSLRTSTVNMETIEIPIKRGIFQGDSLSPIWFVLCLNPLSGLLNTTKYGFEIRHCSEALYRLNHLLFMDDIKLYGASQHQLSCLLNVVEMFSRDISMEFGLDKCKTLHVIRGKLQALPHDLQDGRRMEAMLISETYKYLGIRQTIRIDQHQMKKELSNEFCKRIRKILKTGLNAKNTVKAINTYAATALSYSFGVINWSNTDVEALQRKCRVLMTKVRKHHPKSAVERTMLPRSMGGRGLVDLNNQRKQQIEALKTFFNRKATTSLLHKAICQADNTSPLHLRLDQNTLEISTHHHKLEAWMSKPLHGRHPNEASQDYVDTISSNYWLVAGQLFPETEGFMMAIQDQVVPTRNYLKTIVGDPTVSTDCCRYGCRSSETIQHITSGCTGFAGTEYIDRHNSVVKILHQQLAQKHSLISSEEVPYYKYQPEPVLENSGYRLYYDRTILTDRSVSANRPDIMLMNKERRVVWLVDVAIPNNNNLREKQHEKICKYSALIEPIKNQWSMEIVKIVPIIISSTGLIPRTLHDSLRELEMPEYLWQIMQKAVIIATTRIVRKFMGI